MEYVIFQTSYTDRKTGEQRKSTTYHIRFRDHMNRRQTIAGTTREADTHTLAGRIGELVRIRQSGETIPLKLARWLASQPDQRRQRLEEMELIDPESAAAECPLIDQLDGVKDEADASKITVPGFRQALEARGNTPAHVNTTCNRVRVILDGCGFVFWRDLVKPGAVTQAEVYLGNRRQLGKISGATYNYHVRDFKSFCRWMKTTGRAPAVAMESLSKVKNADVDAIQRRALSTDEMRLLAEAAARAATRYGLCGADRALLYRFCFETGMRPGQARALKVSDFDLSSDPPTVTTHAKYVKRRRTHVQELRPALALELRKLFKTKMPDAPALTMPSKFHMADMLRDDLAEARAQWIRKAANDQDREQRQRSDFLASTNHADEIAVFYSVRHGHGTALAEAGVPEKDIAASMHHASRTTTARYLHSNRQARSRAIGAMTDLEYPQQQAATGTDGAPADGCLSNACATALIRMDSSGQSDGFGESAQPLIGQGNGLKSAEIDVLASWRNWQTRWIQNPFTGNTKTPENKVFPPYHPDCLLNACADDHQLAELVASWPTLPADVRTSMVKLMRASQKGQRRKGKGAQASRADERLG